MASPNQNSRLRRILEAGYRPTRIDPQRASAALFNAKTKHIARLENLRPEEIRELQGYFSPGGQRRRGAERERPAKGSAPARSTASSGERVQSGEELAAKRTTDPIRSGPEGPPRRQTSGPTRQSSRSTRTRSERSAEQQKPPTARDRISRDLHDTLGHHLTVSIVQLEGAERLIATAPERASQMVNSARKQLRDGLSEVRRTVGVLRTPVSTDLSLPKALRELASDFEAATQLPIRVTVPDTLPPLPEAYRLALYRAAQEALTNVQRHAQANEASLTVELSAEGITLRVRDNGIGLPDGADQRGFGLRGMRERITQLGGSVEWRSEKTEGTTVLVDLPKTTRENR